MSQFNGFISRPKNVPSSPPPPPPPPARYTQHILPDWRECCGFLSHVQWSLPSLQPETGIIHGVLHRENLLLPNRFSETFQFAAKSHCMQMHVGKTYQIKVDVIFKMHIVNNAKVQLTEALLSLIVFTNASDAQVVECMTSILPSLYHRVLPLSYVTVRHLYNLGEEWFST